MAGGTASPNRRRAGDRPKGHPSCRLERSLARRGYRAVQPPLSETYPARQGEMQEQARADHRDSRPRKCPSSCDSFSQHRQSQNRQSPNKFSERSHGGGRRQSIIPQSRSDLERAARALGVVPDYLLIDAFALPGLDCPQEALIFGDARCLSIAAASVIAKVERDRLLARLAPEYPAFGFERNKGYGTAEHRRVLARLGPTPQHRYGYAPVRAVLEGSCAC